MASSGGPYSAPAQPPAYQHSTSHTSEGWAAINAEAALTDDLSVTPSAYLPQARAYCFPAIRYDPDEPDGRTLSRIHRKLGAILNEHADGVDGLPGSAFSAAPTHYHVDSLGRVPTHLTNATLDEEEAVNFHNMRLANGADPAIFPPDSVICNRLVDTLIMALLNDRVGIEGGLEHCCCISKEAVVAVVTAADEYVRHLLHLASSTCPKDGAATITCGQKGLIVDLHNRLTSERSPDATAHRRLMERTSDNNRDAPLKALVSVDKTALLAECRLSVDLQLSSRKQPGSLQSSTPAKSRRKSANPKRKNLERKNLEAEGPSRSRKNPKTAANQEVTGPNQELARILNMLQQIPGLNDLLPGAALSGAALPTLTNPASPPAGDFRLPTPLVSVPAPSAAALTEEDAATTSDVSDDDFTGLHWDISQPEQQREPDSDASSVDTSDDDTFVHEYE